MEMIRRALRILVVATGLATPLLATPPAQPAAPARAPGSVLLIAGQSREEFRDYLIDVTGQARQCPAPGGAAFYTNLDLTGFRSPHSNEPGDHHQDMEYLRMVQTPLVMQVALWLSRDQVIQLAAGEFSAAVEALQSELAALKRPVFLRIGYEFDGPHNRYPPEPFIQAWRNIAKVMRRSPDIILVWHSFALIPTYQDRPIVEWYPGDEYVDWMAVSYFQVGEEGYYRRSNREAVIAFAREKGMPVMIAESSPIRYTSRQKTLKGEAWWDYWFRPLFKMIDENPEIRALSIINVNWDGQKQHNFLDWGDCRLDRDPFVLRQWRKEASSPRWMPVDDKLYDAVRAIARPASARPPSP